MKKRIVHYTLGFHYPYKGGVETDIGNIYNMTKEFYEHIVVYKHGGNTCGEIQTISGISKETMIKRRSNFCENFKYLNRVLDKNTKEKGVPLYSEEIDATTIDRINSLQPDIFINYGCEGLEKLIASLYSNAKRNFLKIQFPNGTEMKIIKEFLPNLEIICYNKEHIDMINNPLGLFGLKNKVHFLPFVYNETIFNNANKKKYSSGTINFLYTGRFSEIKRIKELINVFEYFIEKEKQDITLTLVGGSFDKEYEKEVIEKVNNINRIKIIPWKNHEELTTFYKQFDCVIIPSYYESFCSSLLEALACGTTCIINTTFIDYWTNGKVINGCHLLNTEVSSEETLKAGVEYLLRNKKDVLNNMDYSKEIEEVFSYRVNKDKWLKLFE
ncbi:MAG: glycosyltransferase family 4 protein [Clostridia bacterium]|jgi:glycosyltransferase involved in cell wall biosynthesis